MRLFSSEQKTLAVFAHPGHELQCLASLGVFSAKSTFLTDASASTGHSRLEQSVAALGTWGLEVNRGLATVSDREVYAMMLEADQYKIANLCAVVQCFLKHEKPEIIVIDSAEGYNPVHDFCHFLVLFAASKVCPSAKLLETPLTDHPHDLLGTDEAECFILNLDEQSAHNKRATIDGYCTMAGGMLHQEVKEMQGRFGEAAINREVLRPPLPLSDYLARFGDEKPFFERHGEQRVREKKYDKILRLDPHLAFALDVISKSS